MTFKAYHPKKKCCHKVTANVTKGTVFDKSCEDICGKSRCLGREIIKCILSPVKFACSTDEEGTDQEDTDQEETDQEDTDEEGTDQEDTED